MPDVTADNVAKVAAAQCWICSAGMSAEAYEIAPREPDDPSRRWCVRCHRFAEFSPYPKETADILRAGVAALGQPDTAEASSEQEWVEKAATVIEEALEVPVIQVVGARGLLVARRLWPLVRQGALGQPDTAPAEDEALDNAAADIAYWTAKSESTAAERDEARGQAARLRQALEEIAETNGWVTEWVTDPADGSRGPSLSNQAGLMARAALAATDQGAGQ